MGENSQNTNGATIPQVPKTKFFAGQVEGSNQTPENSEDMLKARSKTEKKYTFQSVKISNTDPINANAIDRDVHQNAIESDRAYRKITEDIIGITQEQLKQHTEGKTPLRKKLLNFIIWLLWAQFAALVIILLFNNCKGLNISDYVINIYIVSLFIETLAGLQIMIKFAFDSQQEVDLIKILNSIIQHFKKYGEE